jgi:phosphoglycolate phosphatase
MDAVLTIEIVNGGLARGRIKHALFDFDGTLSLIREGWQGVMLPMMVELLLQTPEHEDEATVESVVREYVMRLTGKQTIYQMIQLAEEIRKRGGQPLEPLAYKYMYLDRLGARIAGRIEGLKQGRIDPDSLMVPGSRAMLETISGRGAACYLASGTDEPFVLDEAAALGIAPYFASIYGAKDDYKSFSKKLLIDRIIAEHELSGPELVAFGDGFVEIEDTKRVGGIAVGVASDEARRTGIDEWKRTRLIEAGADLIVPDFREHEALVGYLWGE